MSGALSDAVNSVFICLIIRNVIDASSRAVNPVTYVCLSLILQVHPAMLLILFTYVLLLGKLLPVHLYILKYVDIRTCAPSGAINLAPIYMVDEVNYRGTSCRGC